jgi:hypothetical protein
VSAVQGSERSRVSSTHQLDQLRVARTRHAVYPAPAHRLMVSHGVIEGNP